MRGPGAGLWGPASDRVGFEAKPRLNMKRECPMCTEFMRLREWEQVSAIPGTSETVRRTLVEWECQECDYFEEASETDEAARSENS